MQVLYFAWIKEKVGLSEETVEPPSEANTVSDLITWLAEKSDGHRSAFADRTLVKAAVDQEHVDHSARIDSATEVAFFPPVTGG
ncbi:MAG: molybdopterin converting factor subunit 1 [Rhodospirillaceae bacterium]